MAVMNGIVSALLCVVLLGGWVNPNLVIVQTTTFRVVKAQKEGVMMTSYSRVSDLPRPEHIASSMFRAYPEGRRLQPKLWTRGRDRVRVMKGVHQ